MGKITVLIKEPNQKPYLKDIENDYKELQKLVGGDIEIVTLPDVKNVICYINEEGKIMGLQPNLLLPHYTDVLVGTCVMVGSTNDGDDTSLTTHQIQQCKKYIEYFDYPKGYNLSSPKDFELLKQCMKEKYDDYLHDEEEM